MGVYWSTSCETLSLLHTKDIFLYPNSNYFYSSIADWSFLFFMYHNSLPVNTSWCMTSLFLWSIGCWPYLPPFWTVFILSSTSLQPVVLLWWWKQCIAFLLFFIFRLLKFLVSFYLPMGQVSFLSFSLIIPSTNWLKMNIDHFRMKIPILQIKSYTLLYSPISGCYFPSFPNSLNPTLMSILQWGDIVFLIKFYTVFKTQKSVFKK